MNCKDLNLTDRTYYLEIFMSTYRCKMLEGVMHFLCILTKLFHKYKGVKYDEDSY